MHFVRNLSIRVPWHDRGWDGHVCNSPLGNSSCLALKLIAENRNDVFEDGVRGEAFDELDPDKIPPCLRSSAGFLSGRQHAFQSTMARAPEPAMEAARPGARAGGHTLCAT